MFTVATCVACHKMNGVGNEFGPDLTKLDPKHATSPSDILRDILEPSFRINEKYQTFVFETASRARSITGLIVEENGRHGQGDREPAGQGASRSC